MIFNSSYSAKYDSEITQPQKTFSETESFVFWNWIFSTIMIWKNILGGNTNSELCSIMLQSHIKLELLFANSFSKLSWITKKQLNCFWKMCTKSNFYFYLNFVTAIFFVRLKKQNAMPGWCSIIFVLVLFLSYLKERNKKKSQKNPWKKFTTKKDKNFCLYDSIFLMLSSLKSSFLS